MAKSNKPSFKRALMWAAIFTGLYVVYFSFSQRFSLNLLAYAILGGVLFGVFYLLIGRLLVAVFKAVGGKVEE